MEVKEQAERKIAQLHTRIQQLESKVNRLGNDNSARQERLAEAQGLEYELDRVANRAARDKQVGAVGRAAGWAGGGRQAEGYVGGTEFAAAAPACAALAPTLPQC